MQSRRHNNKMPTFFVIFKGLNINALMRKGYSASNRGSIFLVYHSQVSTFPRNIYSWAFFSINHSQVSIISQGPITCGYFTHNSQVGIFSMEQSQEGIFFFIGQSVICCLCQQLFYCATYLPTTNTFQFRSFCAELTHSIKLEHYP